jgi:hypothetical protein
LGNRSASLGRGLALMPHDYAEISVAESRVLRCGRPISCASWMEGMLARPRHPIHLFFSSQRDFLV